MKFIRLSILLSIVSGSLAAQNIILTPDVFSSAGVVQTTSSFIVSSTLGDPFADFLSSENKILTVGFQQTNMTITSVPIDNLNSQLIVYPNPTSGLLFLTIISDSSCNRQLQLFDVLGKNLLTRNLPNLSQEIMVDVSNFSAGIYYIKVFDSNNSCEVLTTKILKK